MRRADHSAAPGTRPDIPHTAPPSLASVLVLVQAIEAQPPGSHAVSAFRAALRRKGFEATEAGGLRALDTLMAEIAEADPDRADARTAIVRAAWADLLPGPGGRARP